MVTDFKKQELNIGDRIIFALSNGGYMYEGIIVRFTKDYTIVQTREPETKNYIDYSTKQQKIYIERYEMKIKYPNVQAYKLG